MAHKLHSTKSAESRFFLYCILCSLSVSFGVYWAFCSSYNLHPIQVIAIFPTHPNARSSSSNNLFFDKVDHRPQHEQDEEQVDGLALPNASFDRGVPAEKDDQSVSDDDHQLRELDDLVEQVDGLALQNASSVQAELGVPVSKDDQSVSVSDDQLQRRRRELDDHLVVVQDDDPCHGKRIYVYDDLPRRFNAEILEKCDKLVSWLSFCAHFINHGFGKQLNSSSQDEDDDPFQGWYATDPYMLELIFHSRMRHYRCRSPTPAEADAFFIPYYSGLDALRFLYGADYALRHEQGLDLVAWLEQNASQSWRRRLGHDHFLVTGRTAWDFASYKGKSSWGTGLRLLSQLNNVTSLVMERRPWIEHEQAIPYPTSFHPSTKSQLRNWLHRVETSSRRYLMGFVGAPRPKDENIRKILFEQCQVSASCNVVNCSQIRCAHNPVPIAEQLLVSTFCLQPQGDTYTRRSTFDSLVCGCIPVFFHKHSAYTQYTWHLPEDPESYSIFIPEEGIRNGLSVEEFLRNNYSAARIAELQRNIRQLIPRLIYFHPPTDSSVAAADERLDGVEDAFDVSIHAMIKRASRISSFRIDI